MRLTVLSASASSLSQGDGPVVMAAGADHVRAAGWHGPAALHPGLLRQRPGVPLRHFPMRRPCASTG
jgi:hypothetical protein